MRPAIIQLTRYFFCGCAAVALHFGTLAVLVEIFHCDATVATAIGFSVGSTLNYLLQKSWVFRVVDKHRILFLRYALVTAITFTANVVLFRWLYRDLEISYLLAQVVVTAFIFFVNFLINRHYTFLHAPNES